MAAVGGAPSGIDRTLSLMRGFDWPEMGSG